MDLNYSRDTTSGEEGLRLLTRIRTEQPDLPIVVMTAWGNIDLAVEAMRVGAQSFVQKPWDNRALIQILEREVAEGRGARARSDRHASEQQDALLHPAGVDAGDAAGDGALRGRWRLAARRDPWRRHLRRVPVRRRCHRPFHRRHCREGAAGGAPHVQPAGLGAGLCAGCIAASGGVRQRQPPVVRADDRWSLRHLCTCDSTPHAAKSATPMPVTIRRSSRGRMGASKRCDRPARFSACFPTPNTRAPEQRCTSATGSSSTRTASPRRGASTERSSARNGCPMRSRATGISMAPDSTPP